MKRIIATILAMLCLFSVLVSAGEAFRPSVEYKDVTITPREDPDDPTKKYVADILIKEEGKEEDEIVESVEEGYLYVTPYGEKNNAHSEEVKERLETAYTEVTSVMTVAELNPELEIIAQEINPEYTARNLVVSDLFDIDLSDYYSDVLSEDGTYISITFNIQGSDKDPVAAVLYEEDGQWMLARIVETRDNGDGTMTVIVEFEKLSGPVVLLKATSEAVASRCCKGCPDWCPFCPILCGKKVCFCWVVPQLILIAIIILIICLSSDHKTDDEDDEEESDENPEDNPEGTPSEEGNESTAGEDSTQE